MSMRIVAYLIDRLPATSLGCYGSWQNRTPHLDAIASRGVVCSNYFHFESTLNELPEGFCERIRIEPRDLFDSVDEETLSAAWETWVGASPEGMELDELFETWERYVSQPDSLAECSVPLRLGMHAVWVQLADRWLGEQLATWQETWGPDDLLLITASSGESLAIRDLGLDIDRPLQPAIQHLPLMLALPGRVQRSRRLHAPLGSVDLAALLTQLRAGECSAEETLNDWCAKLEARNALHVSSEGQSVHMTPAWFCVHPCDESDVSLEHVALFHRPEDPWGLLNVASQYPHIAQEFLNSSN